MKDRGFYRTDDGKVYEYQYFVETGEITAFGPVDKFGGGEQRAFDPVSAGSEEEGLKVLTEKLGAGGFENDWV